MPRKKICRHIQGCPGAHFFKPGGIPLRELKTAILAMDEFEAIRLSDHLGLYQENAAEMMGISRQSFALILKSARQKIARTLINGNGLHIRNTGDIQ